MLCFTGDILGYQYNTEENKNLFEFTELII